MAWRSVAALDSAFTVGHRGELAEAGESFEYARELLAKWRREHPELIR